MAKISQVSMTGGEISPSLHSRTDLDRYATSLRTCSNFFVRPTGGASNRAGLQFVYALDAASLAALIPFVYSTTVSYMMVFQDSSFRVFNDGAFVQNESAAATITNATGSLILDVLYVTFTTAAPHGFSQYQTVSVTGVVGTGSFAGLNGEWTILGVSATTFTIQYNWDSGSYTSGGSATIPLSLSCPYLSAELSNLRYTQSADVLTIAHQSYIPHEVVRNSATSFSIDEIADFDNGPFLDDNLTAVTMTSAAATGSGITITASSATFTANHIGGLVRLKLEDFSAIVPWEPDKHIAATGVDPDGAIRLSNGKVYVASGNAAAPASGTFTGTVPPSHDEGVQWDGDAGLRNGTAATRAGVGWQYLHSLFGTARITAIGGGGTTATVDILDYMPVVSPATTVKWALGAWSEDQGYPALVTYYEDRLVFANTPGQPQTQWASKTGDYHNFSISSPLVDDDSISQRLNARQINAITEMVPADQLISLTASASWASPRRGEAWVPSTIGFYPQSFDGAEFLRAILTGDSILYAQYGGTKIRDLLYKTDVDKFRGDELTVLARHLFEDGNTIVDMDYAKEPHGILWIVRSDGALIGLTYLKEQEVIGWHRHDTQGYFERVCVIPENGIDVPYFVVRRTVGGSTVRYLERMAVRDQSDILDSFFVDSGLSYDGRNSTATTITISGASYDGGDSVTLTASAALFDAADIGDAIQFPHDDGSARANITAWTSTTVVTATLQSPVIAALQATATATWTFARDTFSGLSHLEGEEVAILADGSPEVPQTVSGGVITLPYPAGVVHVGLAYTSDIETLDVAILGSQEPVRDNAKAIPQVSVIVEKTLGLKAGPDENNLYDIGPQPADFNYSDPWPLQTEPQTGNMVTSWNKSGRVLLRQDQPLPATILQIIPKVEFGEDG